MSETTGIEGVSAGELAGRVALITGSSSGIGEGAARRLSALGASVVVNSATSAEAGRAVAESLPGPSHYLQADISDPDQVDDLLAATVERFGRLDLLINNAGWTSVVPHHDLNGLTDEIFERTMRVNVHGTWGLTKAAIPLLRAADDGHVITVTSIAGVRPMGSSIAYSMAKAALNHMTLLLAKSHGPVRFNAVAPGLVETPWTETWDTQHGWVADKAPLGRSATVDDCAEAILGLIRMRYATGQVVVVDGGLTTVI
jgi:ketoreductase RED2